MRKRPEDVIPDEIMEAARQSGLKAPLWYAGRHKGKPRNSRSLTEIAIEGRRAAGITEDLPPLPEGELPPVQPDPYAD